MIGNLLEKLFVAVGADLSEFNKEMAKASIDTEKQAGKIAKAWEKLGPLLEPAMAKIKELAKVAVFEMKDVLKDGFRAAAAAGTAAFTAKLAEGDLKGAISEGIDAAVKVGTASIVEGFTSQVLPALVKQLDIMKLVSKAAGGVGTALSGLVPILGAVGKAFLGLMFSPLGLVLVAIAAVVAAFVYWDDIVIIVKKVGKVISDWYDQNIKPTMDKVIAAVKPVVDFFINVFSKQISATIDFISAIIKGDFKGAWEAAKSFVMVPVNAIIDLLGSFGGLILDVFSGIYNGAKTYLMDKLGAIFNWLGEKLDWAGDQFHNLWDRVVGNSYIPDMVDGIADHIGRLEGVMVTPIQRATQKAGDAFEDLKGRVAGLLDNLFPDQAAARELEQKYEDLDKALAAKLITPKVFREARHRLNKELAALTNEVEKANNPFANDNDSIITPSMQEEWKKDLDDLSTVFDKEFEEPVIDAAARISESIADMVVDVDASLRGLVSSIKDGDIVGVIVGIADTIGAIVGAVKSIRNASGSSAGGGNGAEGRATGGNVKPFGTYSVNENGPEILQMGAKGGRVYNRADTQKMLGGGSNDNMRIGIDLGIEANEYFDGRVQKVTAPGHARAAQEGAVGGHSITVRERRRQSTRRIPG